MIIATIEFYIEAVYLESYFSYISMLGLICLCLMMQYLNRIFFQVA